MLNTTKTSGKVIAKKVNRKRYGSLLASVLPTVIKTGAENDYYLAIVEGLMRKGAKLSKEEEALLDLLSLLIETFERRHYLIGGSLTAKSDHRIDFRRPPRRNPTSQ